MRKIDTLTSHRLAALRETDLFAGVQALAETTGWVQLSSFCRARNMTTDEFGLLQEQLESTAGFSVFEYQTQLYLSKDTLLRAIKERLLTQLKQWHTDNPKERGLKASLLTASWQPVVELPLLTHVLKQALQASAIKLAEGYLFLAEFKPAKASEDEKVWAAYAQFLGERGTQIPLLSETTEQTRFSIAQLRKAAAGAVREQSAFKVSERRYALPQHLLKLSDGVIKLSNAGEEISVIALKKEWGLGRNLAVEIVEFFDSVRFTARRDNARIILDEALPHKLFAGPKE